MLGDKHVLRDIDNQFGLMEDFYLELRTHLLDRSSSKGGKLLLDDENSVIELLLFHLLSQNTDWLNTHRLILIWEEDYDLIVWIRLLSNQDDKLVSISASGEDFSPVSFELLLSLLHESLCDVVSTIFEHLEYGLPDSPQSIVNLLRLHLD